MGYMRHHAIVVTSWDEKKLKDAHAKAQKIVKELAKDFPYSCAGSISEITPDAVNGYRSFFVAPDGSKEGWPESKKGDEARKAIMDMLDSFTYDDGSNSIKFAEIQFGDDNHDDKLTRTNWREPKKAVPLKRAKVSQG